MLSLNYRDRGSKIPKIANFLLFQAVWIITILGAAQGRISDGWIALTFFIVVHFFLSPTAVADYALCVIVAAIGGIIDTINLRTDLIIYNGLLPGLDIAPPWTPVLWCALALTLNNSLGWLHGRPLLAALLGAIGGMASYLAGTNLGAATLGMNLTESALWLAGTWAVLTPLLFFVAAQARNVIAARPV